MPYVNPEHKRLHNQAYYAKNRERIKQRVKEWQEQNPDRVKGYKKAWFDANPEYRHDWYLAHREEFLAQAKANAKRRREEDPERTRALNRARAARRRARELELFVEDVNPRDVWERDGGICQICGEPADIADWHLDHIVPIARGGEHSYANTQVAHPICNWRKADST